MGFDLKERLKRFGFTLLSFGIIALGIFNLCSAALAGRVRGRRGWVLYDQQPVAFLFTTGLNVALVGIWAAILYMVWREHRSFELSGKRRRPPLDEARRRSGDL